MRILILTFFLGSFQILSAQNGETVFTLDEFIQIVRDHHPMTYKADLVQNFAEGNLRMARGNFDPKLGVNWDQKSYDEKNYYSLLSGGVKVPTWYGVEFKAGYDRNTGQFLNESDALPEAGLIYGGVSVPLGQGLVIDERRTELQKAKIFIESSRQDQKILLNELIFNAIEQYLIWQEAYFNRNIALEGTEFASIRLEGMKSSFENGDMPAIDTLESLISLQSRQLELAKAEQDLMLSRLALNNFLWIEGEVPLEIQDFIIPENIDISFFEPVVDSIALRQNELVNEHPEILTYEYKIQTLDVEERMNREYLKPDIRIDYNPLYEANNSFMPLNNYKLGVSAAYPLFQRKERGKLAMTRVKIQDTQYDLGLKRQEIQVKLNTYYNLQGQLESQNNLLDATVENYRRMLQAENRKFEIGESSIFLINSREVKYLESRYKLIAGQSKLIRSRLIYLLFSGQINAVI
jgi:outer membrane protein TolC